MKGLRRGLAEFADGAVRFDGLGRSGYYAWRGFAHRGWPGSGEPAFAGDRFVWFAGIGQRYAVEVSGPLAGNSPDFDWRHAAGACTVGYTGRKSGRGPY